VNKSVYNIRVFFSLQLFIFPKQTKSRKCSLVLSSGFKGPLSNTVGQDANVVVFDCSNVLISSHEQIIDEYGSRDKNKYENVQETQLEKN